MKMNSFISTDKKNLVLVILIITFLISVLAHLYYSNSKNILRLQKQNELRSIAELKVRQISNWYSDEVADAKTISSGGILIEELHKYFSGAADNSRLVNYLTELKNEHSYSDILLFNLNGKIISSTSRRNMPLEPEIKQKIALCLLRDSILILDLYRDTNKNRILMGFVSPVKDEMNRDIAAALYLFDAQEFLFPIINYWPFSSISSEAFLFRLQSDTIFILSSLKKLKNAELNYHIKLQEKEVDFFRANREFYTFYEGPDYSRKSESLACISPIPGTSWYVVAQIDSREIYAGLNIRLLYIIIIAVLFIVLITAGLAYLYNRRQKNIFIELYNKEKELWESQQKFKVTIDSLAEGVITADMNGKVQYMNKMAEKLTGWTLQDSTGRRLNEVYTIKNEQDGQIVDNILQKVLGEGVIKEFGNHSLLISKEGKVIPVSDTGAPIIDSEKSVTGLVLTFRDETEKRRHQQDLIESEKRYRSTLENMLEGCQLIDFERQIIYVNKAAEKHSRKCAYELIGRKINEVWPDTDESEFYRMVEECLVNRKEGITELELIYPDGSRKWFEFKIQAVPDGAFLLSYDIDARKKSLEELSKISMAVMQSPVSVIISDIYDRIEYANPKFCEITGYALPDLVGRNVEILKQNNNTIEDFSSIRDSILKNGFWKGELQGTGKNGEPLWTYISISAVKNEKGNVTHFVTITEDITERRKMMDDLVAAKEKAEEINKIKSLFFANMSHELRTPFVGIIGYAELLTETLADPVAKNMASGILVTSRRMSETLTKILALSKAELNETDRNIKQVDIKALIDNIYYQFRAAAEKKKINFSTHIQFNSFVVNTDETLINEILSNLVNNAVKFTDEGSIDIYSSLIKNAGYTILELKVSDTGIGINEDKQQIIWDEFRQASEGFTREYQGTGLGLAIVKKNTALLGGKSKVESKKGEGSVFTIELPFNNVISSS